MTSLDARPGVDPVTFEILRHRLWAINEEAATAIATISGSPVANESYDFNCALMTADGEVVLIGAYVMAHAAALDCIVQHVQRELADNPGIRPGDMFITNDPYVGAMHQPDVALVAPIFDGDRLIAWCGSVVHQTDVGGPVAGSTTVGARSIYEEAIPISPVRLVEGGIIRKDLEREYLIRSRLPGLNALDMRGQVAANKVQVDRVLQLCGQYGTDVVLGVLDQLVEATGARFARRLASLPDGRWRHTVFVEHDGVADDVYEVALTMTKVGSSLELDLTGSSPQAPSLINCSAGTLRGYTLAAVLTLLAYDMPWVPAALWRSITIKTTRGTVVDAEWPAGVAMGNNTVGHAVRTATHACIGMMLDASDDLAAKAMAPCIGTVQLQMIGGFKASGDRFGTMLTDGMAGGMGARSFRDGVDSAGMINAPSAAISNVESNEHNFPLRYLWRRERADSGGAGRYRGGVGAEMAYVFDGITGTVESTVVSTGVEQSTSAGLSGGEPGAPNAFRVVRSVADLSVLSDDELEGPSDVCPPKASLQIAAGDVFVNVYTGGGGFGDPLDRPVTEVARDVEDGLVSVAAAASEYAVVVALEASGDAVVDADATAARRDAARRARLGGREPRATCDGVAGRRASSHLVVDADGSYCCRRCAASLGPADANVKDALLVDELGVADRWPLAAAQAGSSRFVLRHFHCPGCGARIDTELNLAGRPSIWNLAPTP